MYITPPFTAEDIMRKAKLYTTTGSIPDLAESMFELYVNIVRSELTLTKGGRNYTKDRHQYINDKQLTPDLKQELIELISLQKIDSLI